MKIGIDIRNIGKKRTGDEVVFLNLVRNLSELDQNNQYFLYTDITDEEKLDKVKRILKINGKENFKLISLPSRNKFTWNFGGIAKYIKKNPVDIYHTQYIIPFFMPRTTKVVTTIHDVSFNAFPDFIKWSDLIFLKYLIPWSIKNADKVIAVSEFTKKEIIKYYRTDEAKIEVIHNALSDDFSSLWDSDQSEQVYKVKEKYNLPEKYVLYVGTLQPRKNIPQLIKAFAKFSKKMPEVKLVLVGNRKAHNFDTKIDQIIKNEKIVDKVIFPGYIDQQDLVWLYRGADIFAFASLYEGFGIPILEAMSQNLPVIALNNDISREVADEAACLVENDDIDGFSENMYNIIIDKTYRDKLIKLGKTRIEFFSWKKSARSLLRLYTDLGK